MEEMINKDKELNSCLYEMDIWHARHSPRAYSFKHKIFMFYLDLDEISEVAKGSALFGYNQWKIYNFKDEDHILSHGKTAKESVMSFLRSKGLTEPIEKVKLLTSLRVFGYVFNPVSFYFCFDRNDQPICVVPQIGNTFGELKYFYLGADKKQSKSFVDQQTKHYYISPFTDLDNTLDFNIQVPDENLRIVINVQKEGKKFFDSSMVGLRKPLSDINLIWETLKFPLVTFKVIFYIHWHAAVLHFIKKVSHHPKEENPQLQKEVWREWKKV